MATKTTSSTDSMARAVGRRKQASARVRLSPGKGVITVNARDFKEFFPTKIHQQTVLSPLEALNKTQDMDISVKVVGGGVSGQASAVRHGIARALIEWNPEFRPVLKAHGYLTRDARVKERKKPGLHKARRAHQWRKR